MPDVRTPGTRPSRTRGRPGTDQRRHDPREAARYLSVLRNAGELGRPGRDRLARPSRPGRTLGGGRVATDGRAGRTSRPAWTRAATRSSPSGSRPRPRRCHSRSAPTGSADDGEPTWLDARRVASDLPAGELLLLPPPMDGVGPASMAGRRLPDRPPHGDLGRAAQRAGGTGPRNGGNADRTRHRCRADPTVRRCHRPGSGTSLPARSPWSTGSCCHSPASPAPAGRRRGLA